MLLAHGNYLSNRYWRILKIAGLGSPVLRKVAKPIKNVMDPDVFTIMGGMVATCIHNMAVGLAAPQIGESLRMFCMRDYSQVEDPENLEYEEHLRLGIVSVFNPRVETMSRQMQAGYEGCLSDPWNMAMVARPKSISVKYTNEEGKSVSQKLHGWPAKVFLHEYDHLNGLTLADMCTQKDKYITKAVYQHIMEGMQAIVQSPEMKQFKNDYQVVNDSIYTGPEAINSILPEDMNGEGMVKLLVDYVKQNNSTGKHPNVLSKQEIMGIISKGVYEEIEETEKEPKIALWRKYVAPL